MANREILLSLLKQLLDEKLQPLEKRNTNEIKDLGTLAVSMKTIEKNVKASCDMTNRIIEKIEQNKSYKFHLKKLIIKLLIKYSRLYYYL